MRILFLFSRSLDASTSNGGVVEFLKHLSNALHNLGASCFIYAANKPKPPAHSVSYLNNATPIFHGPFLKPGALFPSFRIGEAKKICRDLKIDVVHAQGIYTAGYLAMQLNRATNIPFVVTSHSDIFLENTKRLARPNVKSRYQSILAAATAVTHLTPKMQTVSHEFYPTINKDTVIPNGIPLKDWTSYQHSAEKKFLFAMGRLERGKGFHLIIEAFANLVSRGCCETLVIAGDGQVKNELMQQARGLNLRVVEDHELKAPLKPKDVVFTGYIGGELRHQLMAECSLFLFPSIPALLNEAFGLVQLEAMAASKAIIASDIYATRYLTSLGMQAILVGEENGHAWAAAIETLLSDPKQRQKMGAENLTAVQQFDWEPIAARYLQVYRDCQRMNPKKIG